MKNFINSLLIIILSTSVARGSNLCDELYLVKAPSKDGVTDGGTFYLSQKALNGIYPRKGYLRNLTPIYLKTPNGILNFKRLIERESNVASDYTSFTSYDGTTGFIKKDSIIHAKNYFKDLFNKKICDQGDFKIIAPRSPYESIQIMSKDSVTRFSRSAPLPIIIDKHKPGEDIFIKYIKGENILKEGIISASSIKKVEIYNLTKENKALSLNSSFLKERDSVLELITSKLKNAFQKPCNVSIDTILDIEGGLKLGTGPLSKILDVSIGTTIKKQITVRTPPDEKYIPEWFSVGEEREVEILNTYKCEKHSDTIDSLHKISLRYEKSDFRLTSESLIRRYSKYLLPYQTKNNRIDYKNIRMFELKDLKDLQMDYYTVFSELENEINQEVIPDEINNIIIRKILTRLIIEKIIYYRKES